MGGVTFEKGTRVFITVVAQLNPPADCQIANLDHSLRTASACFRLSRNPLPLLAHCVVSFLRDSLAVYLYTFRSFLVASLRCIQMRNPCGFFVRYLVVVGRCKLLSYVLARVNSPLRAPGHQAPIAPGPHRCQVPVDTGVLQQVLL